MSLGVTFNLPGILTASRRQAQRLAERARVLHAELCILYGDIKGGNFIFAPTKFVSNKSQSQSQGHLR